MGPTLAERVVSVLVAGVGLDDAVRGEVANKPVGPLDRVHVDPSMRSHWLPVAEEDAVFHFKTFPTESIA
jgi:hypothetical protein